MPVDMKPVTWQGLADMGKRVTAVILGLVALAGAWVAAGLPVPASQASVEEVVKFAEDNRELLLLMRRNIVEEELAALLERWEQGERSGDMRKRKLSLERELDGAKRQLDRLSQR